MYDGWEKLDPLGSGGQGDVFLVRNPERVAELRDILRAMDGKLRAVTSPTRDENHLTLLASLAPMFVDYARKDEDSELGALKVFRSRQDGSRLDVAIHTQEIKRLKNEIEVLRKNYPGLPKLLAYNENEFWIITEYFRQGSLENQIGKYRGDAGRALKAFRSLVATAKLLHDEGSVHRDIKAANVFVRKDDELVLGDLGIVFVPETETRVTATNEKVGPSEYMAPWLLDTGERVVDVTPCADVYMLAKLLWCMVAGKLKLFREYHRRDNYDLVKMSPDSPHMERINLILDKCLVSQADQCLTSATELLTVVDTTIKDMGAGDRIGPDGKLRLLCVMCGKGTYRPYSTAGAQYILLPQGPGEASGPTSSKCVRAFVCDLCTHHAFFAMNYPEEGQQKKWKVPEHTKYPEGQG